MAAVSVFVDDAVRGRLPLVCAKTGEPTDLMIRIREEVGRSLGMAWLLVFLGPPGWVALVLVSLMGANSEYLTVRIPETEWAYDREKTLERFRLAAFAFGMLTIFYGIFRPGLFPALWLVLGVAFLLAALALHIIVQRQAIGIHLDASRRWVTLSGVHPSFVRAIQMDEALGRLGAGRGQ
jgi:hypothetical protein